MPSEDDLKRAAALSAVARIGEGMVVGLGSGSTASFAVREIGKRVLGGLRIVGVPTSERTAALARSLGIPLATLAEHPSIDLTIDGADQVEETSLNLIKGLGGALLREKIVASASGKLVIIVHEAKLVPRLRLEVPVEVASFGWQSTARRITGAAVKLRLSTSGDPFVSDGGNYILDCAFGAGRPAAVLAEDLDHVTGVVEHGLFIGMTSEVHVAGPGGVRILTRE